MQAYYGKSLFISIWNFSYSWDSTILGIFLSNLLLLFVIFVWFFSFTSHDALFCFNIVDPNVTLSLIVYINFPTFSFLNFYSFGSFDILDF
jgi:hypothetical protein